MAYRNRQSTFSPLSGYLHKYFSSEWSYARYRLPTSSTHISLHSVQSTEPSDSDIAEEEKCVVAWVEVPVPVPSPTPPPPTSPKLKAQSPSLTPVEPQTRMEHQLVALTYSGGWYRLSIPSSSATVPIPNLSSSPPAAGSVLGGTALSSSPGRPGLSPHMSPGRSPSRASVHSVSSSRPDKGKERERDSGKEKEAPSRQCVLEEFRRYGRWDGWG